MNDSASANYSFKVSMFDNVGKSGYSIQDLKPVAPAGVDIGGGALDLQTVDEWGAMVEQFYYMTAASDGVEVDGWYNDDGVTLATKTLKRGEGFQLGNATETDVSLTYAGQVELGEVTVSACANYSLMGNIRALTISIQDLKPTAFAGVEIGGGALDLQTVDEWGAMSEQFYYMTAASDGVEVDGWYNDDGVTLSTKTFEPGEGFQFGNATEAEITVAYTAIK